jgi:hypothetical protein
MGCEADKFYNSCKSIIIRRINTRAATVSSIICGNQLGKVVIYQHRNLLNHILPFGKACKNVSFFWVITYSPINNQKLRDAVKRLKYPNSNSKIT